MMVCGDEESDVKKPVRNSPLENATRTGSPFLRGVSSILDGMASIGEGMATMFDSLAPGRRSPRMRRILKDLELPDAERLRRDGLDVPGWYDMDPWYRPVDAKRVPPRTDRTGGRDRS